MDWVWSALHLDDGTHLHGVDIRIPGAPAFGLGYIQTADRPLVELQSVVAREGFGDNGLPISASVGDGDDRRRPNRCRLGGMEPQPAPPITGERACLCSAHALGRLTCLIMYGPR